MNKRVTIKIVLDTRRAKDSGLYPVKIRVTHQRIQKYFSVLIKDKMGAFVPFDLSLDDFNRVYGEKPRGEQKDHRIYLDSIERKANAAVESLASFTFKGFETAFYGEPPSKKSSSLEEAYKVKIATLWEQGKISSAKSYECSLHSLTEFRRNLNFSDVTPRFLQDYTLHMDRNGKSAATTGIYLRNLRALFHEAMGEFLISRDSYPFGKVKGLFQIPSKGNPAQPLRQSEVAKIYHYQPQNEAEAYARDLWIFAFLLNGANMKDVCLLKYKDIDFHGKRIIFYRSKTRTTAKEQKAIEVTLTPEIQAIIDRWGNPPENPHTHVFPIFEKGMTETQQFKANGNIKKTVRKYMERIAERLNIEKTNIHNYTGRDSFAAAQREAGESGDAIGEALGHENRGTTDAYLDKFKKDTHDRMAGNALKFIGILNKEGEKKEDF